MIALPLLNAAVAAVSVGFAVTAAVRPAALTHSTAVSSGERFYAWMYTARGVPVGILAGVLPLTSPGTAAASCLVAAAVAQLADVGIGVARREWRMAVAAGAATAVHLITAIGLP